MGKTAITGLRLVTALCFCIAAYGAQQPAPAENSAAGSTAGEDTAALAKAAQNPVSSMISVPFQYNLNLGVDRYDIDDALLTRILLRRWLDDEQSADGVLRLRIRNRLLREWFPGIEKHERTQHVINIQPVYPINIGKLNLINRVILPVMYQPLGEDDGEFGLGDTQYTLFFSPAESGKIIWGIGPAFSLPTATDDSLGTGKWSAGPSAVVLTMPGRWVFGALASNLWSFAGENDSPDVNSMLVQPFINYNLDKGWYLTSSPIITANWEADSDDRWTVPVGAGLGKIFKVGKQPLNAQLGAYYNVEKPDGGADWNLRFQLQFMFPKQQQ
ncbi:MAG TPA: neuromedin U [Candidatus Hydrogenedentes bacterium]|nr:neuromedin U [Candidatus Hydrogenedentota bacterium]